MVVKFRIDGGGWWLSLASTGGGGLLVLAPHFGSRRMRSM